MPVSEPAPDAAGALEETRRRLKKLESRDWWLWGTAVTILLLIASALFVLQLPGLMHEPQMPQSHELDLAVRALFVLVALFSAFAIYQQIAIKRLRSSASSQIGMIAALEARAEVFEKLAILDPLTGLFNRRFATDHLPAEIARAERQGYPFTLLMIDLNGFKQINDVYGHAAGDLALREFAHALKKSVRSSDLPVRMGGDEFMVLLPECRAYSVPEALARLKGLVINHNGSEFPLKFSAGWAEWRPGETPEQLVERTDHAVYTDKRTGKAAEQVQRAEAYRREGQKLQVVGQMTGRVAHDFNNLMTVITGYSEMLLHGLEPENPLRPQLENIRKAAATASQLTQQLLAFTRKTPSRPRAVSLNQLFDDMEALIRPLLGERMKLVIDRGSELRTVQASATQLEQIVMTLVNNARDAIGSAGDITISTSNVELDLEFERTHPGARCGPCVRLVVSDSGIGMDSETLARIFEPSSAAAENGKPKRPGLVTLYGIVKQLGGYITAESELRRGSRFTVYLPEYVPAGQTARSASAGAAPEGKRTVMVVESVDTLREMTCEVLRTEGFHVLPAMNAADAITLAGSHDGPIVLTLTDIVLPGTSCRELAAMLTERRPEMKVLYMGGYTETGTYDDIVRGPAFLESPFSTGDLSRKIEQLLGSAVASGATGD